MIEVSALAARQYAERVDPSLSPIQAVAAIKAHAAAIEIAAAFGCSVVKCAKRYRLILQGAVVVTVHMDFNHVGSAALARPLDEHPQPPEVA